MICRGDCRDVVSPTDRSEKPGLKVCVSGLGQGDAAEACVRHVSNIASVMVGVPVAAENTWSVFDFPTSSACDESGVQ